MQATQGGAVHMDAMTQKGNSAGGCNMVARAWRAEERPWGGARESQSTENSQRSDWKREMLVWKKMKKAGVGRIMVLGVTHLYKPVLALRTSQSLQVRSPTTGMLF